MEVDDALRERGLLDENTFLYLEEFILHETLRNAGLVSAVVPSSIIVHKGRQSTAREASEVIRKAGNDSLRHYLVHCRHYPRFIAAAIMLSARNPIELIRQRLNRLKVLI